jgi:subtilisin family serine protease
MKVQMLLLGMILPSLALGESAVLSRYGKTDRWLELQAGKAAMFGASSQPSVGIELERRTHPIKGWSILALPAPGDLRRQVDQLTRDHGVFVAPVVKDALGGEAFPTRDLFVAFQPWVPTFAAERILVESAVGTIVERSYAGMTNVFKVRLHTLNGFDALHIANLLAGHQTVRFAEPDFVFTGRHELTPDDPGFDLCWGLHNTGQFTGSVSGIDIDAPDAWDLTTGLASVRTLVIDSGIQLNHPDLNLGPGVDVTTDGGSGGPRNAFDNHGTTVAGCISAIINNTLGTVGVAPNTQTLSGRAMISGSGGSLTTQASWTVDVLAWGEAQGARVTNNSNSYGLESSLIDAKYEQTRQDGMVHFASSGNSGNPTLSYPARIAVVNAVGGIGHNGIRTIGSNYGEGLRFVGPAQQVYTTDRTGNDGYNTSNGTAGDYVYRGGTSYASAYVAGVAALLLSHNANLTPEEVEAALTETCRDLGTPGWDDEHGWGLPNAHQALLAATTVRSVELSPSALKGGATVSCVITLGRPAPTGGLSVNLLSSHPAVIAVPPTTTIAAGETTKTLTIDTQPVSSNVAVTITASRDGFAPSAQVTVEAADLSNFTLSAPEIQGGDPLTGTLALDGQAPTGGAVVGLSSGSSAIVVPASVTIPHRQVQQSFTIQTREVGFMATRTITASYRGIHRVVSLTLRPRVDIATFTLLPSTVTGGLSLAASLTLTRPAPAGGAVITIRPNTNAIKGPASITVPEGSSSADFTMTTVQVGDTFVRTVDALFNGRMKTAVVTLIPVVRLDRLVLNPSTVQGGQSTTGNVSLVYRMPHDVVVQISTDSGRILVPPTVTIPAGQMSVSFTVNTLPVGAVFTRSVIASATGVHRGASLTLTP